MTNLIISEAVAFREELFACFEYRADATMDAIDAIAGTPCKESVVKISLSPLFRRKHDSIHDVIGCLFKEKSASNPSLSAGNGRQKIITLLSEQCETPKRKFALFAVDCTPNPRIYSKKLEDRGVCP